MAGASLLALLDDIAMILDDVGVMTKVAAQKTSGVLGDDLALNAQQVTGMTADRELPVVWAVAKGSFINKLILVPLALLLGAIAPDWVITALLMIGGAYLCFEGFEKLVHKFLHSDNEDKSHHDELIHAIEDNSIDMVQFEKDKIKGAVRTDFVLSAEIIAITLGVVISQTFLTKAIVLTAIAIVMTIGVYGLVAGIVKLDDLGFYLNAKTSALARRLGAFLLWFTPYMMKSLAIVGTAAMFLVGGGIIVHGIPMLHHLDEGVNTFVSLLLNAGVGVLTGALVLLVVTLLQKFSGVRNNS